MNPKIQDLAFAVTLQQAKKAFAKDEVPIGAVIVKDGRIIARSYNQTESKNSFLAHAEMLAIHSATKKLKSKYLTGCELYVSLEPCMMCRVAAKLCRIEAVHFLLPSEKFGKRGPGYRRIKIRQKKSSLTQHAKEILQSFFLNRR